MPWVLHWGDRADGPGSKGTGRGGATESSAPLAAPFIAHSRSWRFAENAPGLASTDITYGPTCQACLFMKCTQQWQLPAMLTPAWAPGTQASCVPVPTTLVLGAPRACSGCVSKCWHVMVGFSSLGENRNMCHFESLSIDDSRV